MPRPDNRILLASILTGVLVLATWSSSLGSPDADPAAINVQVEPQLIGPGTTAAWAQEAGYGVQVDVPGASAGQDVRLEVWHDGDWVTEDEGTTDERGRTRLVSSNGAYGRIVTDVNGTRVATEVDPDGEGPLLYWTEEFNEDALSDEWLGVPQPDGDKTCTTSDESAASVEGGVLALTVEEEPGTTCKASGRPTRLNGHIILRGAVTYGTTAARIRFPRSRDVTGEFWLQPGDPGLPWVMDGAHEGVVVAATTGTDQDPRLATAVHSVIDGAIEEARRVASSTDAPNDGKFHVYSVDWRPDGYTFKIDGRTIRTVEAGGPLPPMTIALALLAPGPDVPSSPEDRTMYVDWLRVWA